MKMMIRNLTLASWFLWMVAIPVAAQDFKIEAGRSIGKIKLGMTRQAVHKTLGKPAATYRMSDGKWTGDVWMANTGNDVRIVYSAG